MKRCSTNKLERGVWPPIVMTREILVMTAILCLYGRTSTVMLLNSLVKLYPHLGLTEHVNILSVYARG